MLKTIESLKEDLFENMYEYYKNYISSLQYERLIEELKENDCDTEEEYLDLLLETDPIDWYIMNFGKDDFYNMIETCGYEIPTK